MTSPVPWLSEPDVASAVAVGEIIDALQRVLEHESAGLAYDIPKTLVTWEPASSAHALGSVDTDDGLVSFKTWVNTPAGAKALLTLFDSEQGQLLAVMEANTLGALRTAAISGLATRFMSEPESEELAIIGSGRQALGQVAAIAIVRKLRRVRVWSPTPSSRAAFAEQIRSTVRLDALNCPTLEVAVAGAPIVTVVTRATQPFVTSEHLACGAHLNAVGAVLPRNAEFDPALLGCSELTVVDNLDSAQRNSRELREHFGDDWSGVRTLSELVTGKVVRPAHPRCTVFKSMGMGLSDLAVANLLRRKAAGWEHPQ